MTHDEDDVVSRTFGSSASSVESNGLSRSDSVSRSYSRSRTSGGSRSVVPITRHEEFQEETGRAYWSVDEQWEALTARVHQLGKREALIRVYNGPVLHVRTPHVPDQRDDRGLQRFKETVMVRSPHVQPADVVLLEIEDRRRAVAALVEASVTAGRPFDVKTFKE